MLELRTLERQGHQNTTLLTKNQDLGELNLPLATLEYVLWVAIQGSLVMGTRLDIFHITKAIHARISDRMERKESQYNTRHKEEPRQEELILSLAALQYALLFSNQGFLLTGTQLDSFRIAQGTNARTSDPRETRKSKYSTRHKEPRLSWNEFATDNFGIHTVGQHSSDPPDRDSTWYLPYYRGHSRQNFGP